MDSELVSCKKKGLKANSKMWLKSSKDGAVRVWNRNTLELHRSMRGHEGPVNAVGLQNGRVVRPWFVKYVVI